MVEVQILIPLADNAGAAFAAGHDRQFAAELLRLFPSGYSELSGIVSGEWRDPLTGSVFTDKTRVYAVWVPGLLVAAANVLAAARFARAHYGQLAIGVRYLDHAEVIDG